MTTDGVWLCTAYDVQSDGGVTRCSAVFRETEQGWQQFDAFDKWTADHGDTRARHLLVKLADLPRHPTAER